jgi:formamidopyrimidine-DNA glycosylase
MPELPEVETIVRQLRPLVVGRTLTRVRLDWAGVVQRPSPARFRAELAGRRIVAARRRAKYFVFDLDDGRALVGHLRMTGRLAVEPAAAAPLRPEWVRASFELDDGSRLVFADVRKFGRLALVPDLDAFLPAIGPEPLSDAMDGDWMAQALAARRRLLKPLLLDQSFLAGLGNIYVDEALHLSGLHPLRSSHRVSRAGAVSLAAAIKRVLARAIEAEGSSFDAFYRTPEGKPGSYQDDFLVYGRDGQPCRACGSTIVRLVVGQRGTHVCPRCQPRPRAAARAAARTVKTVRR